ncbi:dihydroxyacetone kinase phosphoryl donor subunit DhaM [Staphylococcus lutrae]|uniref:phosphoenolpyruvate--glycerone phosphotransferase n=1 Tax=Staphylococcus lutrae TaxID=155085 RepID=A0AAC9RNU0_9STAP|nr:dihydroxyacetone kinase phosphoryl donor subunit DhaM [Staphylococcus lutrae]ARJ50661.1 PTS mannose transporter subunit IIA [Staphylococcus lutrae]PNZ39119.1 PTS-dependent dihydroxyacetone kinase phosphotransferase subunit DhaM [Staphylococcus lutrae]
MTQIVLVSHSEKIAEGVQDLLAQMAGAVKVVAIGGIDGEIGTSFDDVFAVLNELEEDAICFYDIGSSEMNLDMAIEMYVGGYRIEKVDAPIVEGSFIASVALSTGQTIDEAIASVDEAF